MNKVISGAMLFIAMCSITSKAAAEQATLQVRNGQKYSGELIEYVPGDHVTLGVGPGKGLRFATSDLVSFDIGAPVAKPTAAPAPAAQAAPAAAPAAPAPAPRAQVKPAAPALEPKPQPPAAEPPARKAPKAGSRAAADRVTPDAASDLVRAAAVNALMNERADWQARDTNLARTSPVVAHSI